MSKVFFLLLCIINLSVYSEELLTDAEVTNFRKTFSNEINTIKKDEKITYEAIAIIKLVSKYLDMINGCSLDDSSFSKLYSLNKNEENTNEYFKQSIWTNNYLKNLSKSILEGVGSKGIKRVKIKQNEFNIYEKSIIDIGKYTYFKIENNIETSYAKKIDCLLSIGKEEIRNIGLDFYKLKGDMNVFKQKHSDRACSLYSILFAALQNEKLSKEFCSKLKLVKDGYYINDVLITTKEINEIGKSNKDIYNIKLHPSSNEIVRAISLFCLKQIKKDHPNTILESYSYKNNDYILNQAAEEGVASRIKYCNDGSLEIKIRDIANEKIQNLMVNFLNIDFI